MIVLKGLQPLVSLGVARAGRLRVIFHLFYQVASGFSKFTVNNANVMFCM